MALAQEDIETIRKLIREEIEASVPTDHALARYDIELRERLVRLEEELKHQRELMEQGFRLMERRFEEQREDTNKRFEQMDRHFEQQREDTNKRFEQMDRRFEELTRRLDRMLLWSFSTTVAVGALVVAALRILLG